MNENTQPEPSKQGINTKSFVMGVTFATVVIVLLLASFLVGQSSVSIPPRYLTAESLMFEMETNAASDFWWFLGPSEAELQSTVIAITNAYVLETAIPGTETAQAQSR